MLIPPITMTNYIGRPEGVVAAPLGIQIPYLSLRVRVRVRVRVRIRVDCETSFSASLS